MTLSGFGKSACYQIPSMVLPKPVVVISPLLALLKDQHEKLVRRDIECIRLDGTVRDARRRQALARIEEGFDGRKSNLHGVRPGGREALASAELFAIGVDEDDEAPGAAASTRDPSCDDVTDL